MSEIRGPRRFPLEDAGEDLHPVRLPTGACRGEGTRTPLVEIGLDIRLGNFDPGRAPSMTAPTAGPWDSPHVRPEKGRRWCFRTWLFLRPADEPIPVRAFPEAVADRRRHLISLVLTQDLSGRSARRSPQPTGRKSRRSDRRCTGRSVPAGPAWSAPPSRRADRPVRNEA